jgi:dolichyl-phosphate beta-glucosyltransferase
MFDTDLLFAVKNLTLPSCQMIPAISIVIPAYEEQTRLGDSVRKILAYIKREKLSAELIVVDDGSKDNTAAIAECAASDYSDRPKSSVTKRIAAKVTPSKTVCCARPSSVSRFSSDADLSTPIEELPKLVEPIKRG